MKFKVLFFFFLIFIIPSKGESSTNTKIPKTYILFSTGVICGTDENGMIANKPRAIKYKDGCCSVDIEDGSGENWHKKGDLTDPHFLRELFPYDLGGNTPPKVYLERPPAAEFNEKSISYGIYKNSTYKPVLSVFLKKFADLKTKYEISCCLENDPFLVFIHHKENSDLVFSDPFYVRIHENEFLVFLEIIVNSESRFEKDNYTLSPETLNFKKNFIKSYGKQAFDLQYHTIKAAYKKIVTDKNTHKNLKEELKKKQYFLSFFIKNGTIKDEKVLEFQKEYYKLTDTFSIFKKISYRLKFLKTKDASMSYLKSLGFRNIRWVEDVEGPTSGRKSVTLIYFTKPSS